MFNLVEQLYIGTLDVDRVNLNFDHLKQRLREREINRDLVENLLFNEEMLGYTKSDRHENGYELFYSVPKSKNCKRLKVCIKVFNNNINVMTAYWDNN